MAKIAVGCERAPLSLASTSRGTLRSRILASGDGWLVEDVVCTAGPRDPVFEEQHSQFAIAVVLSGTFQYRTSSRQRGGGELMSPGSILLGNPGQSFECGHQYATGDRCLSFRYAPDFFERIAADKGVGPSQRRFRAARVPPVRRFSNVVARASAHLANTTDAPVNQTLWEELSLVLAAQATAMTNDLADEYAGPPPSSVARVTRAVRMIEAELPFPISLKMLAQKARLSPFHFLRTFEQVTGVTPHQYLRRARLRRAAARLKTERMRVLDLALDCGFGDVSNFNRAFHEEFGTNPREYRRNHN